MFAITRFHCSIYVVTECEAHLCFLLVMAAAPTRPETPTAMPTRPIMTPTMMGAEPLLPDSSPQLQALREKKNYKKSAVFKFLQWLRVTVVTGSLNTPTSPFSLTATTDIE